MSGDAFLSAWWLPTDRVPDTPDGVDPLLLRGRALALTAWVRYLPPSPLTYHELLTAVAVHEQNRVAASITDIWVDSAPSRAGGRELWGIPKELAALEFTSGRAFTGTAATGDTWISTAAYKIRSGPPFAAPSGATVVQAFDDCLKRSSVSVRGKPRLAAASWNVNPEGPLGYLAGRSPFLNLSLHDFAMNFRSRS